MWSQPTKFPLIFDRGHSTATSLDDQSASLALYTTATNQVPKEMPLKDVITLYV